MDCFSDSRDLWSVSRHAADMDGIRADTAVQVWASGIGILDSHVFVTSSVLRDCLPGLVAVSRAN